MRVRRFLHIVLFSIACLLAWQIVEAWRRPLEAQHSTAPQNLEEKPLPVFHTPPPQTGKLYASIIADKDLFVPSRSRAAVEVKPVVSVPPPSHLKLVGVVLAHGREEALFADSTQGGKVARVRKGEALGAYKLVEVAPLQATLTLGQDGDQVSLPLLVIDSNTAAQGPHLMPAIVRGNQGRRAQSQGRQAIPLGNNEDEGQTQSEAHAIRQNIQQLQQRLRQIRRQAVRNGGGEGEEENEDPVNEGGGDEEDDG